ncbi:MAG: nucleotide exchange factor GrpE [Treponema sp.]|nr:nucleotide exchange factor GrpE [Treponema sp.]
MSEETKDEELNENKTDDAQPEKTGAESVSEENASESGDSGAAEESAEEKIARLEKEIEDLKKEALYKAAENDNWRKRMMQQKEDAVAFANESLLSDLLDSLDNFDRTVEAAKDASDVKTIAEGITMINKGLVSMLENKYNLVGYGEVGDVFDPDIHEAIGMQEGDVKEEQLAAVYLKGYKLKNRVIRHAKVMVVKPKAE